MPPLIVLTDDNDFGRGMLKMLLEVCGNYTVIDTPSALEALSICRTQAVSLLICDYLRPDINGREVLQRLRANPTTAHIPFMLCTAGWYNPWEEADLNLDGYLLKPFEPDELVATVQHLLEERRLSGQLIPLL